MIMSIYLLKTIISYNNVKYWLNKNYPIFLQYPFFQCKFKLNHSLKNSSSNNMNEHIESLQIDLNSIKEYLTSSSFSNQLDNYTINNVS